MKNSTYLYSDENRDLYQEYLNGASGKKCSFSKQVPLYLERSHDNEMKFFSKHLMNCSICQDALRKEEDKRKEVLKSIPFESLKKDLSESLKSDFREISNIIIEKEREHKKRIASDKNIARKQFFYDVTFGFFRTPTFIKGALLAAGSFAFLHIIFR